MKLRIFGIAVLGLILLSCIAQHFTIKKYKNLYSVELQNVEAYKASNSGLENEVMQYQMTVKQLSSSKDSTDRKIVSVMNELGVAKKKVTDLQYELSHVSRHDTITLSDTVFMAGVDIDTLVGDKWYSTHLRLRYPSTVELETSFDSEEYVYIYENKEYVNGKSRFFFINWFKKKYNAVKVEIEEKNPYIRSVERKFIKVS